MKKYYIVYKTIMVLSKDQKAGIAHPLVVSIQKEKLQSTRVFLPPQSMQDV